MRRVAFALILSTALAGAAVAQIVPPLNSKPEAYGKPTRVPAARDVAFPGTLQLTVDASELMVTVLRQILTCQEKQVKLLEEISSHVSHNLRQRHAELPRQARYARRGSRRQVRGGDDRAYGGGGARVPAGRPDAGAMSRRLPVPEAGVRQHRLPARLGDQTFGSCPDSPWFGASVRIHHAAILFAVFTERQTATWAVSRRVAN